MVLSVAPMNEGFRVEGELDMASVPILDTALEQATSRSGPIVLDFDGVSFMDSSGLRLLLRFVQEGHGNRALLVQHTNRAVRKVFDVSLPNGAPGLEVRD